MELEGSLPCPQQPASWPLLGPDESKPSPFVFPWTLSYTLCPSKPASSILSLRFTFPHHTRCNSPPFPHHTYSLPQLIWI